MPLLERLRFLCIVGSNLDEFFEIRVAGLKEQLRAKVPPPGMTLHEARDAVAPRGRRGARADRRAVPRAQRPGAAGAGRGRRAARAPHRVHAARSATWAARYFAQEVRPLLTPIGLDPAHPFPQVVNKSLNFVDRAGGPRRVRPRHGHRDRQGAARAAAHHQAAARGRRRRPRVRDAVVGDPRASARALPRARRRRATRSSASRATPTCGSTKRKSRTCAQALQGELPQRQFGSAVRLEVAAECPAHSRSSCCSSSTSPRPTCTAATARSTSCGCRR